MTHPTTLTPVATTPAPTRERPKVFIIEKGIALPERTFGTNLKPRETSYPFAQMAVGDSFFVRGAKQSSLGAAANSWGKKHGMHFATRIVEGGVRVWRDR